MFIIRRSKLHYTASGIITPIGGRLVYRLREETATYRWQNRREGDHWGDLGVDGG